MAIGYLNQMHVSRGAGRSAVGAAAYAARTRLYDERTGRWYDYSKGSGDVPFSGVFLPKGAPERFRDRATLWNEAEQRETKCNARTARHLILALPHELTAKQQQHLLQDFIRENLTRKGLAVDASIHGPDAKGDDRNDHAHLIVTTRFVDAKGLTDKDRVSNEKATQEKWKANWARMANRQLVRYGHAPTVGFETPEGQEPQIHLGAKASALERKGIRTRAGDSLREIVNDNDKRRAVANDLKAGGRKEVQEPEPATIDRDAQDAEWQDAVDQAGIDAGEARLEALAAEQATERQEFEQHGREMTARHSIAWNEVLERYHDTGASYQSGAAAQAAEATEGAVSFLLSLFTGIAESFTRSMTGKPAKAGKATRSQQARDKQQDEQRRRQQQQALEALMAEQAEERAAFERRREEMMRRQELQRGQFEEPEQKRWGALQTSFDREASFRDAVKDEAARKEARQQQETAKDKGPQRDGPD